MTIRKLIEMGVDIDKTICVRGIIWDDKGWVLVEEDCSMDCETFEVDCGTLYIRAGVCQNEEVC